MTARTWVVVVGVGAFATCYGPFASYEAAFEWTRLNQFDDETFTVLPITVPGGAL